MKTYVKPDVFYENFELSQHVASCAWDMSDSVDANSCSAVSDGSDGNPSGISIFNGSKCGTTPEDYCYTNGASGINTFNS